MKLTVTLQIASTVLTIEQLLGAIGYTATKLTLIGRERTPPRTLPKANLWNGGLTFTDVPDADEAISACLDRYPDIVKRMNRVRKMDPGAKCTFHVAMRPFTRDFILYLRSETVQRLAQLICNLDIEYFGD